MLVNIQSTRLMQVLTLSMVVFLAACERPPVDSVQQGFRGTGMVEVTNPRIAEELQESLVVPEPLPTVQNSGQLAGDVYQNVQVLGDLDVAQFTRFMAAITAWVSPEEGCTYCHAGNNFAEDNVYTKTVSRRMIQMTWEINSDWDNHVGATGVTCYTCHKGENVPGEIWYENPGPRQAAGFTADSAGQNTIARAAADSSLPYDPFTPYLLGDTQIQVIGAEALPQTDGSTLPATKQTEETYSLMMHMSDALGVNCTYCHNSRAFSDWSQSSPARMTAWYGIRMARALNTDYIQPLTSELPDNRLGPLGDAPKVNCATCHGGMNQPLMGANMLEAHPELAGDD